MPRPLWPWPLTLKVVSESRVTCATSVPILVFLGLCVLDLGLMYATDRRRADVRQHHCLMPPPRERGIISVERLSNRSRIVVVTTVLDCWDQISQFSQDTGQRDWSRWLGHNVDMTDLEFVINVDCDFGVKLCHWHWTSLPKLIAILVPWTRAKNIKM